MRGRSLVPVTLGVVALLLIVLSYGDLFSGSADLRGLFAPRTAEADAGLGVTVSLSRPGNGAFLVAGERAEVTIVLKDKSDTPLTRNDIATLGLYAYGPQETTKTVSAVKLLNATADRSKTPHHFIDLLTNSNVRAEGNVLRYTLQPVSDEEAGTYTLAVRAVKKGDTPNQMFVLADFQLGTSTVEKQIVEKENCAACHRGASSGQFYFRHTDPTATNAFGSPSLDSVPVRTCKACHNNEGYAAFRSPVDGSRVPDQIVNRVHGIHMGEHLKNPLNIDPETGVFREWTGVLFPANVKNCTACHADDRYKTQPSRLGCGTCHDNTWFGEAAALPQTAKAHPGGPQANDSSCAACHPADSGGVMPVSVAHKVSQLLNDVEVSMSTPANGAFYVAGEAPLVTMVIKDDAGDPIDHTKVEVANFSTAGLFVSGNRAKTVPVLTNTAKFGTLKLRASATNTRVATVGGGGWTFGAGATFKIAVNANPAVELRAPQGFQTPNQVRDWLAANLSGVTVTATATQVTIRSNIQGEKSRIEIYNSAVTDIMAWKPVGVRFSGGMTAGLTQEPFVIPGRASYPTNDLRKLSDPLDYSDPAVTRNVENITYQLDDVAGLAPGTYSAYVWIQPVAGRTANVSRVAIGFMNFQVGTATVEKKVATNCTDCHKDNIFHLDVGPIHPAPFDTDYCKSCHDYRRNQTGDAFPNQGGTSLNGWSGYGAVPIARRIHGVHFGRYLEHPEQIYQGNPDIFREVIFPQDVRNCTKCHDAQTTSGSWKENPSRLACMSCHDRDAANGHARLQTLYTDPSDPWSDDKIETCVVCHGADREWSPDKVHNISDPYKPPYAREPER